MQIARKIQFVNENAIYYSRLASVCVSVSAGVCECMEVGVCVCLCMEVCVCVRAGVH